MAVPIPGRMLLAFLLLAAAASGPCHAQISSPNQAGSPSSGSPATQSSAKKATATPAIPTITDPRQAQIVADTQKLLKLSQELKVEVAKSNKDTLSLTVIKKAEEVEKLAKTLKDELDKAR